MHANSHVANTAGQNSGRKNIGWWGWCKNCHTIL